MRIFTLLLLLLLGHYQLLAQQEDSNWHFGLQAAVSFGSGAPVVQPTAMRTYEAASSISDATGQLLFYSSGEKVWNRNHVLMPNGGALSSSGFSSTQGVLIVPHPGNPTLFYVFLTDEMENQLTLGCRYALVDMKLAGGLGDVTGPATRLPTPALTSKVAEKLVAVRHANGRDYWIVVHGWENNAFYSFLLTTTGVVSTPVSSHVGPVLDGTGGQSAYSNAAGHLRASPDGRHLAMAALFRDFGLYDFDPATGQVANYVDLTPPSVGQPLRYGVEFAADNSRLYLVIGSAAQDFAVVQYDMLAGSGSAIAGSRQVVGTGGTGVCALLRAPTGKIYMASYSNLHVINQPTRLGAACDFQLNAVSLNGAATIYNLPNQCSPHRSSSFVQFTAPPVCAGAPATFTGQFALPSPPLTTTWNFGDAAAGAANTAAGPSAVHTYSAPGTYTATLTATIAGFVGNIVSRRDVVVAAAPTAALGAARTLCAGQTLVLDPGPQPAGTTYRWQDGTTAPVYPVRAGGKYVLTVTSPAGCIARDSVLVQLTGATDPALRLQAGAPLCPGKTVALGPDQPQLAGSRFRWQDGSTAYSFVTGTPGTYTLSVTTPGGCERTSSLVLGFAPDCTAMVPNVITPNRDAQNDTFVLEGLDPADWSLAIYNRWGREVLRQASYDNSWGAAGHPAGLYYYLLTNRQTGTQRKGWLEVVK